MTLNDAEKAQLEARLQIVRDYEARVENPNGPQPHLTGRHCLWIALAGFAAACFFRFGVTPSPIPDGRQYSEQAAAYLKKQYPNRVLQTRFEGDVTASVAVVYHIIRNGQPEDATSAIEFAASHDYGYATPYVIERLLSDDPQLSEAARNFLRGMAGEDYGPQAKAWNEWWNNLPRQIMGLVTIGERTLSRSVLAGASLLGVLSLVTGLLLKKDVAIVLGAGLLFFAWCQLIVTIGDSMVGSFDVCRFGDVEITYHQGHGIVYGLEDAYVGGMGLWSLLCLAFVGIPILLAIAGILLHHWLSGAKDDSRESAEAQELVRQEGIDAPPRPPR